MIPTRQKEFYYYIIKEFSNPLKYVHEYLLAIKFATKIIYVEANTYGIACIFV